MSGPRRSRVLLGRWSVSAQLAGVILLLASAGGLYLLSDKLAGRRGVVKLLVEPEDVWVKPEGPYCSDTCFKAKDGVCDEGSVLQPGLKSTPVMCDLGTDCSDCGAWHGAVPKWDSSSQPVAGILAANETVRVRPTTTKPSFLMPITDAKADPDVSSMVEHYGALEGGITRVMREILSNNRCLVDGPKPVVLDVGANFGYYAIYAAMHGCRVIAWEPVPLHRAYLAYGAALNNVSHLIEIRSAAVSSHPLNVSIGIAKNGTYWGLASVDNMNLMPNEVKQVIEVPTERLDARVSHEREVILLKVDVEGYEPWVMSSAPGLLRQVQNVLLEYSPGVHERKKDKQGHRDQLALPSMLQDLALKGFALGHLPTAFATPWPPKDLGYDQPLPTFDQILPISLKHDREAIQAAMARRVAKECDIPEELKNFPVWRSCHEWAMWVHPKGFRSSFGFNTNVWAARTYKTDRGKQVGPPSGALMQLGSSASLFGEGHDMKIWTSAKHPDKGIGMVACKDIGAGHQVLFHCPCSKPETCSEEAKVVNQLAAQGKMVMQ